MAKIGTFLRSYDVFGDPIGVNLKGETSVKTSIGALFTFLTFTLTIIYAYIKTIQLI